MSETSKSPPPPSSPKDEKVSSLPMSPKTDANADGSLFKVEVSESLGNEPTMFMVHIDRGDQDELPYRGGYKDIRDGTQYMHAVAQTREEWPPGVVKKKYPMMCSRETQLSELRTRVHQTYREAFTQMDKNPTYVSLDKNGVVIDNRFDYYRIAGPYEDADAWMRKRVAAAIVIQKHTRRKIAQRTAKRKRQYAQEKKKFWIKQDEIQKKLADEKMQYQIQRRMNPLTKADFEILYEELEHWRLQECEKITSTGDQRIRDFTELINKELKVLQMIDNLRCRAARLNQREQVYKKLAMMAIPKVWELSNGQLMHVQTPSTIRAGDLGHLYEGLAKKVDSIDERMAILGYVKWTVQLFDSPLTHEILLLLQREADLMYRGRSAKSIFGLRRRILHLFLKFIENPQYNPEAIMFQSVPTDFDYGNKHFQSTRDGPNNSAAGFTVELLYEVAHRIADNMFSSVSRNRSMTACRSTWYKPAKEFRMLQLYNYLKNL